MRLLNVSIHTNFYLNQFTNVCAKKKKAKIPESYSFRVSEFIYRDVERTYVLQKNLSFFYFLHIKGKLDIIVNKLHFKQSIKL